MRRCSAIREMFAVIWIICMPVFLLSCGGGSSSGVGDTNTPDAPTAKTLVGVAAAGATATPTRVPAIPTFPSVT